MESEFNKDYLPGWCELCDEQGVYFVDDSKKPYHVIHQKCGFEILSANCPDCQAGFELTNKTGDRPNHWICPVCEKNYPLDEAVFDVPIDLYIFEELPETVRSNVLPRRMRGSPFTKQIKKMFPDRALLTILGVILLIFSVYSVMETACFPEVQQSEGKVIGYGCEAKNDVTWECFQCECNAIYSIVSFIDANGNSHTISHHDENLSGEVILQYRLIDWSNGFSPRLKGIPTHNWWYYSIHLLFGILFISTGSKGFLRLKKNEQLGLFMTAALEKLSIRKLNWICPIIGFLIISIAIAVNINVFQKSPPEFYWVCIGVLDYSVWIFPGVLGIMKTDFVDETHITKEKDAIKWSLKVILYISIQFLIPAFWDFFGDPYIF